MEKDKIKKFLLKAQKGQLLIESIVAISLIVVGLLGMFALLSQSLGLRRVVSERYIATYLATEGIEIVKNMLDTDYIEDLVWNNGANAIGTGDFTADYNSSSLQSIGGVAPPLSYDSVTGIYSYDVGDSTKFRRTITTNLSADGEKLQVNSVVDWITRGGGQFTINLEDHFFNWR